MGNVTIDSSELEYLKSCRDKLQKISELIEDERKEGQLTHQGGKGFSSDELLREIKRIVRGEASPVKSKGKPS